MVKKKGKKKGKKSGKKKAKKSGKKKSKKAPKVEEEEEHIEEEETIAPPKEDSGGTPGLFLIPLLAVVMLLWAFAVKLDMLSWDPYIPEVSYDATAWVGGLAVVQIIFILILGSVYSSRKSRERVAIEDKVHELEETYTSHEEEVGRDIHGAEVDGEELLEVEPEYIEVEIVEDEEPSEIPPPAVKKDWGLVEYPPQITGGVYADTLIPVGRGAILKLRTIIARACLFCDKQVECWPKSRRHISKEDFMFNTECKGGLRRLGVEDI